MFEHGNGHKQKLRCSYAAGLLSICLLAVALSVRAETYVLSSGGPPNRPWGYGARLWADMVAERTQGRIVFNVVPDLALVGRDGVGEFVALASGRIDAALGSSLAWSGDVPSLALFALPCLIDGPGDLEALVTSPLGATLFEDVRAHGVEPLAWGDAGAWAIAGRTGALTRSRDLAGLTLRVPAYPPLREAMMVLGVDPIAADLRLALTQARLGMIDGIMARLADLATASRPPEGYDTWTVWPCVAEPLVFAVNRELWLSWPLADRMAVAQGAIEAAIAQARSARALVRTDAPWLAPAGITLVRFPGDRAATLSRELSHIRQRWAQTVGTDLVLDAEQILLRPR